MGNLLGSDQQQNTNSILISGLDILKKYEPDFLKKEYCETIHSGFTYYRYYINYNNKENVYPIWAINREEEVLYTFSLETIIQTLYIKSIIYVINAVTKQKIQEASIDIISKLWSQELNNCILIVIFLQNKKTKEQYNKQQLEKLAGLNQLDNKLVKIVKIIDNFKPYSKQDFQKKKESDNKDGDKTQSDINEDKKKGSDIKEDNNEDNSNNSSLIQDIIIDIQNQLDIEKIIKK